jgi:hypothetical protein
MLVYLWRPHMHTTSPASSGDTSVAERLVHAVISCPEKDCTERIAYRFGNPVCPKHGPIMLSEPREKAVKGDRKPRGKRRG